MERVEKLGIGLVREDRAGSIRLTSGTARCQGRTRPLDGYGVLHNNTPMRVASPAPVCLITKNLVRSAGATG